MKLPRPFLLTKDAAAILGVDRNRVFQLMKRQKHGLPYYVVPDVPQGRGSYRIRADDFERWLFETRNEEVLRKLGWEPSFLVASPTTEIARSLKEACLEDDIPILFASDTYSAGMLCKRHCPVGILIDYSFGDFCVKPMFACIREKWPWMNLFVAAESLANVDQYMKAADKVFLTPVDPEAVRAAILGEDE